MRTNRIHYTWNQTPVTQPIERKPIGKLTTIDKPSKFAWFTLCATLAAIVTQNEVVGVVAGVCVVWYLSTDKTTKF